MLKFKGSIQKEVELPAAIEKKPFHPTLWNIERSSFAFPRVLKGKVTNLKIPGFFQKSVSSRIFKGKVRNLKYVSVIFIKFLFLKKC